MSKFQYVVQVAPLLHKEDLTRGVIKHEILEEGNVSNYVQSFTIWRH